MSEPLSAPPVMVSAAARVDTPDLVAALEFLRRAALELEESRRPEIELVAEADRPSAVNLVHYLAVRQFDLRPIQRELANRGLSSLGRAEGHVLATIDAVLGHLVDDAAPLEHPPTTEEGAALLDRHTVAALGPLGPGDRVRLMVTLPSEAAEDVTVVGELVAAGMDIARINCAHDGPEAWRQMAANVHRAGGACGRDLRVAFDLAGPKLRTGPLAAGPAVVKVRPERAVDGRVLRPARVRFVAASDGPAGSESGDDAVVVPVDESLVTAAEVGDILEARDARGRRRCFSIVSVGERSVVAISDRTSYLATGLTVERRRGRTVMATGSLGTLPPTEPFFGVRQGDRLRIRRGESVGVAATKDDTGHVVEPACISCAVDELFSAVSPGQRVLIDDGRIDAIVDTVADDYFEVVIVRPAKAKLKAAKGINLPDTDLRIGALTEEDRTALAHVAPVADLIALSYVGSVDDVAALQHELDRLGRHETAVVLKIEHATAFRALPRLLLHGLRRPPLAVMVARGDLAVEIGFERLAEVQEEILWLCEAAHVPVIWATQVLETLAKDGVPTRAEVTDAAWASRAECVMLNKGPHIASAMRFLDDVFARMHEHQDKRTPMLRRLSVSTAFGDLHDLRTS